MILFIAQWCADGKWRFPIYLRVEKCTRVGSPQRENWLRIYGTGEAIMWHRITDNYYLHTQDTEHDTWLRNRENVVLAWSEGKGCLSITLTMGAIVGKKPREMSK